MLREQNPSEREDGRRHPVRRHPVGRYRRPIYQRPIVGIDDSEPYPENFCRSTKNNRK